MNELPDGIENACIRILIADDHSGWRTAVRSILSCERRLQVVAEAADGLEAVQKAVDLSPDMVLMDISMPVFNGMQATRRVLDTLPDCKIIILTEFRSPEFAEEAMRNGATGYVIKSSASNELIPAIQAVFAGKVFISNATPAYANSLNFEDSASGISFRPNPFAEFGGNATIQEFLESVVFASRADFGNVQLFDSANNVLRIVAHFGFGNEFLEYFDTVAHENNTVCSGAMAERQRVVASDILRYPFASSQAADVLRRAHVGSCQSTPLLCNVCGFMGVVSTHYARPGGPPPEVLQLVDRLTDAFIASICESNTSSRSRGADS
jgi:DNA-binding NarL/FixJ family response regulator